MEKIKEPEDDEINVVQQAEYVNTYPDSVPKLLYALYQTNCCPFPVLHFNVQMKNLDFSFLQVLIENVL